MVAGMQMRLPACEDGCQSANSDAIHENMAAIMQIWLSVCKYYCQCANMVCSIKYGSQYATMTVSVQIFVNM
jgi:hypothetical protein